MQVDVTNRLIIGVVLVVVVVGGGALGLAACKEEGQGYNESDAIDMARRFHNAVLSDDSRAILEMADYPFNLDDNKKIDGEPALLKQLEANLRQMRRRARAPALLKKPKTYVEVCSYEELVDGKEINGKSFTAEEARKRARVLGLREGGLLVRCYHVCEETSKKAPDDYYLVMHQNEVGDLKITTYYD